ncbi:hypothetical protein PIIN_10187 [Serendipita indica DSM 11827]|uniref:F-box domain-containing protein n=1 Tax=Serendipita indica (strain DSM 11827) TaxID=1109443 RepID=G4TY01_SERID|nr:hypothetical protein PIIN_10187 [Serendipita indica DSM 11827]
MPWGIMQKLLSSCVSLVSLTVTIDWEGAQALISMIPRMIYLEYIAIQIGLSRFSSLETIAISSGEKDTETKIRSIKLYLFSLVFRVEPPTRFLHSLFRMSPRLESLGIYEYHGKILDFTEIDRLEDLRNLSLKKCRFILDSNVARHILASPSLEVVNIEGSIDILNSLGSRTAIRLHYGHEIDELKPRMETITIRQQDWPSLQKLMMWTNAGPKIQHVISMTSLRQLVLSERAMVTTVIHLSCLASRRTPFT